MIKIKFLIYLFFFFSTVSLKAQTIGKGVYHGQNLPFEICYFTYNDSTIEVEYFFQKGGQIFGHIPPEKLERGLDSFSSKPIFKSVDDSIMISNRPDHYLIKRKGSGKIKVYKSNDEEIDIITLRNRNRLFAFSHSLYNELNTRDGFDEQKFWNKFNSYQLKQFLKSNPLEFNKKLEEVRIDIKNNWL